MGISAMVGGITLEEVRDELESRVNEAVEDRLNTLPITLGTENAGIIIHGSSGTTKNGVTVETAPWIEIYGAEIHFSDTS